MDFAEILPKISELQMNSVLVQHVSEIWLWTCLMVLEAQNLSLLMSSTPPNSPIYLCLWEISMRRDLQWNP